MSWPPDTLIAYAAQGLLPPLNGFEHALGLTRLGSVALRALDQLAKAHSPNPFAEQIEATKRYLTELKRAAADSGSQLLVLLIPSRADIADPSERYQAASKLMQELKIPYMRVRSLLDPIADYAEPPDLHWNNSGHQKVGALLSECVGIFFSGGQLADCPHVTMP